MHGQDSRNSVSSVTKEEERKIEKVALFPKYLYSIFQRFMHMLALILFVFFITYLPGFVIKVVVDRCYKHPTLHAISYVFNWASVWINPVIYIAAQKKYQVTFIKVCETSRHHLGCN